MKSSYTYKLYKEKGVMHALKILFFKQLSRIISPIFYYFARPLPTYHFLFLTHHATGHTAMMKFLTLCGLNIKDKWDSNGYQRYKSCYTLIKTRPYPVVTLCEYNFEGYSKFVSTLFSKNNKIPVLILVRDPISICKSMVNFVQPNRQITINGGGQYNLKSFVKYHNNSSSPNICRLESDIHKIKNGEGNVFILSRLLSSLPKYQRKYFVDIKEIYGPKTFETMKNLSDELRFPAPKNEHKHLFEQQLYKHLYHLLPLTLNIKYNEAVIQLRFANQMHKKYPFSLTQTLIPKDFLENPKIENVQIYLQTQKEVKIVNENLKFFQTEVVKILEALIEVVNTREKETVSEQDILAYFKTNPQIARDFKTIFDQEYQFLKQERPDIIKSWKHYQEFEKLCEELYQT